MIAIDVELLTGRYVATSFGDRRMPEWPPHPARLFSALLATASEHDDIAEPGRRALEWLEQQPAPRIFASDASPRAVVTVYVPENTVRVIDDLSEYEEELQAARAHLDAVDDAAGPRARRRAQAAVEKAERQFAARLAAAVADDGDHSDSAAARGRQMLPDHRGKQPRTLPSVTPEQPRIRYAWSSTPPDDVRAALAELARRLVRLGHSSTLVSCRFVQAEFAHTPLDGLHTWVPSDDGPETFRVVMPGQVANLHRAYQRHHGVAPRILPARHQAYHRLAGRTEPEPPRSVFGEWLVLREIEAPGSRRLGLQLTRTEDMTRALRGALLHHADDPPPMVLSGHRPDGQPLDRPHVAYLALADVASRYASGAILGAAVLLPRDIDPADRHAILRAVGRWERAGMRLLLGRVGALVLERVVERDPRTTLDPATWMGPSRRWASVTPVALDENPGDLTSRDPDIAGRAANRAEDLVARACEYIGLPRPRWVQVMRRSLFDAAPAAMRFMPFPRRDGVLRRVCVHVEMRFDEPVRGPVLLGAGRFFGIGLCRPRREG